MGIILASASPRRFELLGKVGLRDFWVSAPEIDENPPPGLSAPEIAAALSRKKAESVNAGPGDVIIAADTVVCFGEKILGKPANAEEAEKTLAMLAGNMHTVYTGVTVLKDGKALTETETTQVYMRELSQAQIKRYVATGEPQGKAGAYGIQERGALLIKRVEGDFYNVMGLPVYRLSLMLGRLGVELL
ncbi:MAG: Maf family protein [Oscillospiraceae bacterium]|jgi:septum formation protein|nr:Maf family protein [Oscillospiraceae bacterium]